MGKSFHHSNREQDFYDFTTDMLRGRIYYGTGIELKWNEVFELKHYLICFRGVHEKDELNQDPIDWTVRQFMLECFPLDSLDFQWGTPEFKEYCRNHVDEWRAERELI
jgi:hypothetical protein